VKNPKILIFKLGLLGDVIMTTPFVRQLRSICPRSEIQYWTSREFAAPLVGNPHLSRVLGFDSAPFYRKDVAGALRLRQRLRSEVFDIGFFLGKHWFFNAFAASLGIPRRIGFAREPISRWFLTDSVAYRELRHEIHYYLDLLNFVGEPDRSDIAMEVATSKECETRANSLMEQFRLDGFIGVINSGGNNAGESGFVRRLPSDFFVQLVRNLAQRTKVVLFGNTVDGEYYGAFSFPREVINLAGRLSFHESLALMRRANRMFTTDCGGMHMAGVVNRNITAFFGPAHPARKAPLLGNVEIVWPDRDKYDAKYDLYNLPPAEPLFQEIKIRRTSGAGRMHAGGQASVCLTRNRKSRTGGDSISSPVQLGASERILSW